MLLFAGVDFTVAAKVCATVEAVAEQFAFQLAVGNARRKQLGRNFLFTFLFHKVLIINHYFLLFPNLMLSRSDLTAILVRSV